MTKNRSKRIQNDFKPGDKVRVTPETMPAFDAVVEDAGLAQSRYGTVVVQDPAGKSTTWYAGKLEFRFDVGDRVAVVDDYVYPNGNSSGKDVGQEYRGEMGTVVGLIPRPQFPLQVTLDNLGTAAWEPSQLRPVRQDSIVAHPGKAWASNVVLTPLPKADGPTHVEVELKPKHQWSWSDVNEGDVVTAERTTTRAGTGADVSQVVTTKVVRKTGTYQSDLDWFGLNLTLHRGYDSVWKILDIEGRDYAAETAKPLHLRRRARWTKVERTVEPSGAWSASKLVAKGWAVVEDEQVIFITDGTRAKPNAADSGRKVKLKEGDAVWFGQGEYAIDVQGSTPARSASKGETWRNFMNELEKYTHE